ESRKLQKVAGRISGRTFDEPGLEGPEKIGFSLVRQMGKSRGGKWRTPIAIPKPACNLPEIVCLREFDRVRSSVVEVFIYNKRESRIQERSSPMQCRLELGLRSAANALPRF